jgi:hypothetical protein
VAKKRTINKAKKNGTNSLEDLVNRLIAKSMNALEEKKLKVTVGDLIRMRDFQKEFYPEPETVRQVEWIDGWH